MRKTIDLAFKKADENSSANLYLKDDLHPADIVALLREYFNPEEDEIVCVRLIADDRKEKEIPFTLDYAKEIHEGTKNGRFENAKGCPVRLLAFDLNGDHPILGVQAGIAIQWNAEGLAQDGNQENKLKIIIPNKPA